MEMGYDQEFEIGHNRGGHYPRIACHTHVSSFDDLCHAYRNPTITLKDHQQFMLDGKAWQRGGARPFAGLNKLELQTELQVRVRNHTLIRPLSAPSIDTMDKTELQVEFNRVKKGFCNFPALATSNPNAGLGDLHLAQYEVAPTEPLHDFKGHMANVVAEVRANTQGVIHEEVEKIYKATLKKDTVRGVDYRKATILFSNTFDRVPTDNNSVNGMKDGATKTQKTAITVTNFLVAITLKVHLGEISKHGGAQRL